MTKAMIVDADRGPYRACTAMGVAAACTLMLAALPPTAARAARAANQTTPNSILGIPVPPTARVKGTATSPAPTTAAPSTTPKTAGPTATTPKTGSTSPTATTPKTGSTATSTTTTAPAGSAQPGTVAPTAAAPTTPATAVPPTAGAPTSTAPATGATRQAGGSTAVLGAARKARSSHTRLSTGALVLAALGALLILGCLAWALGRWLALEPRWTSSFMHSLREASYRASATWAEFGDWARLGR